MAFKKEKKTTNSKTPFIVGGIVLFLIIVGGVFFIQTQQQAELLAQQEKEQAEAEAQQQQPSEEEIQAKLEQEEKSNLSDEQIRILDSYSTDQKEMQTLLMNNKWTNSKQTDFITFGEFNYVETKDGQTTDTKYFVICSVYKQKTQDTSSARITYTMLNCLDNQGKYYTILVSCTETGNSETKYYGIECSNFSAEKNYSQVAAAENLVIDINENMTEELPFSKEVMFNLVRSFVQENYPTSKTVTFDVAYEIAYEPSKQYTIYATLDNTNKSRICVMYDDESKGFSVEKASSSTSKSSFNKSSS